VIEVVRILLALVFVVAGVAKLLDLGGSRRAIAGFGVPAALARPLGLALPLTELAIASTLLVAATSRYAAMAAAALLAVFSAAIGISLVRGRRLDCHCFGRLHSAPAGWATLARNLVLVGVAATLALAPGGAPTWLHVGGAALVVAVGGQALLWVALLRRYGRALRQIDELETATDPRPDQKPVLEVGAEAPHFELPGLDGAPVTLTDLLTGARRVILVATDERCGACTALYPEIARWQQELRDQVAVVVLGGGSPEKLRAVAEEHELDAVLLADRPTLGAYGMHGTPSALLIDPDVRIASPVRYGGLDIEALVLDAVESNALEVAHHG
jgi:peroxiredoxin